MRFRHLIILAVLTAWSTACNPLWAQSNITLSVDRATGAGTLVNTGDANGDMDGYAVESALGSLTPGSWNSLEDQANDDWLEAGTPTDGFLSELKKSGQTTLAPAESLGLGGVYSAAAAMQEAGLGNDNYEDLVISVNNPNGAEGPETTTPDVVYTGDRPFNNLVVTLNRETGQAVFENQSVITVALDGYAFTSTAGSLNPAWNSLEDQGVGSWVKGGSNSINVLTELNPTGSSSLANGATLTFDNVFDPAGGALAAGFGVDVEDVVFEFGDAGLENSIVGIVQYEGDVTYNNLVINVDSATGEVVLENESPHTVSIDGYTIASAAGSLDPGALTGLGGGFISGNTSANRVSELNPTGGLTLNPTDTASLGNIFAGGTRDLTLEFDFEDPNSTAIFGFVKYSGLPGDFDENGLVDGADLLLWQRDMSVGNLADWEANFGAGGSAAGAASAGVPEPSCCALIAIGMAATLVVRRRRMPANS